MKETIIEFISWGIYLIFPLIIKCILFTIEYFISTIEYEKKSNDNKKLTFYPAITIIISVGNCEKTLRDCIESILNQKYPLNKMQILLIDNDSTDKSKDIFYEIQMEYSKLRIWWIDNSKNKVNAVNKGIYMAEGKYIINVDCDGIMGENLIKNFVYRFENDPKVCALSAAVVTDAYEVNKTNDFLLKLFQKCQLWKLGEVCFIEKRIKSRINFLFTLSKHCSAFRKDILLKTRLYNGQSINQNIHIGSEIKEYLGGKLSLEEDCLFYIKPIKSLEQLSENKKKNDKNEIKKYELFEESVNRTNDYISYFSLLRNHIMIFAQVLYLFSMIYLMIIKNSILIMVEMTLFVYLINLLICFISYMIIKKRLSKTQRFKLYMKYDIFVIYIMPIYILVSKIFKICEILDLNKAEKYL